MINGVWPVFPLKQLNLRLLHTILNSLQPHCGLSHSGIIFQKAQSHISTVLFVDFALIRGLGLRALLGHRTCHPETYNKISGRLTPSSSLQP